MTDKAEDKKMEKKPKIHGTLVKVTDDNADEVAKAIMEKIRKVQRSKGHKGIRDTQGDQTTCGRTRSRRDGELGIDRR